MGIAIGRSRGGALVGALALTAVAIAGAALASGEPAQSGNLIVSLRGGIVPRKLPRDRTAPVSVSLASKLRTADGTPVPRLRQIELALAGRGLISARGLPACPRARLRNATSAEALARCGGALVGRGRLEAEILLSGQAPLRSDARVLVFNGRGERGGRAIWMQVFSANPPLSFVLPFAVRPGADGFATVLRAPLPQSIGAWTHVRGFRVTLNRRYRWHGEARSYVNASCPAPPRFTAGFFTARATYTFAGGRRLRDSIVRSCRVRP